MVRVAGAIAVTVALLAAPASVAEAATHDTALVSRVTGPAGASANRDALAPSMSADGTVVAFESYASNLVGGDTPDSLDVFVRSGTTTTLVSQSTAGVRANGVSAEPSISADGRYVAFSSAASNLHADDADTTTDVFVRDTQLGTTTLVSRSTAGTKADAAALFPSISGDGTRVAFQSAATNLSPDDGATNTDVYVRDLQTGTTTLVSRAAAGANGASVLPAVNGDGTRIAFQSDATNLHADDTNADQSIFLRDTQAGTTALVSRAQGTAGASANAGSLAPSIDSAGVRVAFESRAANLNPLGNLLNGSFSRADWVQDVFVRDVVTGATDQASTATGAAGEIGKDHSFLPSIAPNGRRVAFFSRAGNLAPGDGDEIIDAFVRDLESLTTTLVSRASGASGAKANGDSFFASALTANGRRVAFTSSATNLSPDDSDAPFDVFTRDLEPLAPTMISSDPPSGANDNTPLLKGTAPDAVTVEIFAGGACTGSPVATGSRAQFEGAGIEASVPDDSTTVFKARSIAAGAEPSGCSINAIQYAEETSTPAPVITDTDPDSPSTDNNPRIKGTAPAGTTVRLYANATCTGTPLVTDSAAVFASPGLPIAVGPNSTTAIRATADNGGIVSRCSAPRTYVEDSFAPAAPEPTATTPPSPANHNTPRVRGRAEDTATVELFDDPACANPPLASGSGASFGGPGLQITVGENSTTRIRARQTDQAGNVSPCSPTFVGYAERSTLPPPGQTFVVTTSSDVVNDGCTAAHCTLREAIEAANADAGRNLIAFKKGGTPVSMEPYGPLPDITGPTVIEGETASQALPDGQPDVLIDVSRGPGGSYTEIPSGDVLKYQIGSLFSPPPPPRPVRYDGLVISGADSVVSGIGVVGADGHGIVVRDAPRTTIRSSATLFERYNFRLNAPTSDPGTVQIISRNLRDGIHVERSPDSVIGGDSMLDRNVITYNARNGIAIDNESDGTLVEGNVVGLQTPLYTLNPFLAGGNLGSGVLVEGAGAGVRIGAPGDTRNVISRSGRAGVELRGGDVTVEDNWIGPGLGGGVTGDPINGLGNAIGVLSSGATGNRIGTAAAGNVISGNRIAGVAVVESARTARDVRVQGNAIGPAPAGGGVLPNGTGVVVGSTDGVLVGGSGAGEPNTIHANGGDGVEVDDARVDVERSSTHDNAGQGIDVAPNGPQGNDAGDAAAPQNRPVPASALNDGNDTVITGTVPTAPNRQVRVEVFGQPACDITGVGEGRDLLGTQTVTADGSGVASFTVTDDDPLPAGLNVAATATSAALGTSEHSPCIRVRLDPPPNTLTVTSDNDVSDGTCNLAHCSLREAITAANTTAATDIIDFAIPGAGIKTIAPTSALPQIMEPTLIDGASQQPGTTTPDIELRGNAAGAGAVGLHFRDGNSSLSGFVVNRFTDDGIRLDHADAISIEDTHVGLALDGTAAGNGGDGIELFGARVVTVARAVVAGNALNGISARTGTGPTRTSEQLTVQASKVGTNVAGTAARPNGQAGIAVSANGSLVGGPTTDLGNVISGNTGIGLSLAGTTIKVQNNRIGTTANGLGDLGNGQSGVHVNSTQDATIGGGAGLGNVISGNGGHGIEGFSFSGDAGTITHNVIGTDVGGGAAIANTGDGVHLELPGRIEDNVISGNGGDGLHLDWTEFFPSNPNASITRNTIGRTGGGGNAPLPNAGDGIELSEGYNFMFLQSSPQIADNVIGSNGGTGLRDQSQNGRFATRNNAIFDNGGLGIDRGEDGITENDEDDIVGPPNFPALSLARRNGNSLALAGTLDTSPDFQSAELLFFSSPACDPSGRGEGRTVLGGATVEVEDGHADFDITLPVDVPAGHVVTATHQRGEFSIGGSSEFSRCRVVPNVAVPDLVVDDAQADEGDAGRRDVPMTVRLSQATTVPVTVGFAVAGDTATSGKDMEDDTGEVTVPAGATTVPVPIGVYGDTDPEGDEFATLQVVRASGAQVAEGQGVLRIRDDDGAPDALEARAGDASVTEGDATVSVDVPVTLTAAPLTTVTVAYETVGLEALSPDDYGEESGTVTFAAGDATETVSIDVAGDNANEGAERFFLALSAPAGAAITKPTGTVTVADDDAPVQPPPDPDPDPDPQPEPKPKPNPTPAAPVVVAPDPTPPQQPRPPAVVRPPAPAAPGVAAQNGCLNGPITGIVARMAQVAETDLCVEGPADLARLGCLPRGSVTHRFGVTLKTVRRTRKGRVAVPRRRSLVTLVRFTLNGKPAGVARRRPFRASLKGSALKPGVNVLKAAVRLRDPLKRGKVFRTRSLTFRFRSCS